MFAHWFDMCTVQLDDSYEPEALAYCQQLPKVELHAHLNGSVRDDTIRQLVAEKGITSLDVQDVDNITSKKHRTLEDCFKLFDMIHQCTSDHASITRITQEVIHDVALDNVFYLELRTTPKHRPQEGMTKASYAAAVIDGMQRAEQQLQAQGRWIMVRLLLSIDRREDAEAALETVQLAASLQDKGVVGIDLSGNPRAGNWKLWGPALQEARACGLRVTLHAGEVPAAEEVADMLRFKPDRLGHMCCLDPDLEQQLLESRIPVELCLTSNIKTCTFSGYPDHHFCGLHAAQHPIVLCTDDSGVFGTTLSKELAVAMTTFKLTGAQMQQLTLAAVDHTFLPPADKEVLRNRMQAALQAVELPEAAMPNGTAL